MLYTLKDTARVEKLFQGWEETLIYSCLQQVMGTLYVSDLENPRSAMAHLGSFVFFAGDPKEELVLNKPDRFVFMVPQDERWAVLIESCFPSADKVIRYAIKKNTRFQRENLEHIAAGLPSGYEIRRIDADLYDMCLQEGFSRDFVQEFVSKEQYVKIGRGYVVLKDGKIVSGASSYSRYLNGIEIEVNTTESEKRKGLASVACATLILDCLNEGLYPSWDAATMISVHLAEKLGYEFSHEYVCYVLE